MEKGAENCACATTITRPTSPCVRRGEAPPEAGEIKIASASHAGAGEVGVTVFQMSFPVAGGSNSEAIFVKS